jgi:hypothetical protein
VLFIVCNYLKYHRKNDKVAQLKKNTIFHANFFVHKFNMLNSSIDHAIQSYINKQQSQQTSGKENWSQKCKESSDLIRLFREFEKDN